MRGWVYIEPEEDAEAGELFEAHATLHYEPMKYKSQEGTTKFHTSVNATLYDLLHERATEYGITKRQIIEEALALYFNEDLEVLEQVTKLQERVEAHERELKHNKQRKQELIDQIMNRVKGMKHDNN